MLLGSQLSWRPKPATILSGVSCRSSRISDEANFDEKAQEFLRECCEISNYQYHPTVDCTFTFQFIFSAVSDGGADDGDDDDDFYSLSL